MRKKLLVIILFCVSIASIAQSKNAESLEKELEHYTKIDTIRVQKILAYGESLVRNDNVLALKIMKEANELAKNLNWHRGQPNILLNIAYVYGIEANYDSCISLCFEALKISEDYQIIKQTALAHRALGESYRLMKNDRLGAYHVEKYLEIATSLNDTVMLLDALQLRANLYAAIQDWKSAKPLLDSAYYMAKASNDEFVLSRILMLKGEELTHYGEYNQAIVAYKECAQYSERVKRIDGVAWSYAMLSRLYAEVNKKDSAYYYGYACLKLSRQRNLKKEMGDAYEALFAVHNKFGDYKKAIEFRLIYDSIYNEQNNITQGQNVERARAKLEQERIDAVARAKTLQKEADSRKTKNIQFFAIGAIALLALFLFWNNRQKQKAKVKIEKAYAELKSTQAQLIHSEKMASLGELTAGIAHEIQNPLNFVNNFSEVNAELIEELKTELATGNQQQAIEIASNIKENEEKINHHGKRADAIVKGMLQHSRSNNGQKELTDINALADEYLRLAYHGIRAKNKEFNATIETDFDKSIGNIKVVPQDIGRVILNLITNAFYTVNEKKKQEPEGYEPIVTVSTKRLGSPLGDGGKIEIRVADNGNGIPESQLEKIFQPFFTTKPTGQGTGLGLSISYDIVKVHGGELKVETMKGHFSEFILTLPNQS